MLDCVLTNMNIVKMTLCVICLARHLKDQNGSARATAGISSTFYFRSFETT